jgi:hypothetical protein
MHKYTEVEERYIEHYQKRWSLKVGQLREWIVDLIAVGDMLVNVQGANVVEMNCLKAEAYRRARRERSV